MAQVSLNTSYAAEREKNVKTGTTQNPQTEPVSIYDVLKTTDAKKTRQVYRDVKRYYKDNGLEMEKEYKRPNWFQRVILGKKDNNLYRTRALESKQNDVLETGAGEDDIRRKTYQKLVKAGFLKDAEGNLDVERLVQMYNDRAGADNYINYGHDNSEFRSLRADFNEIGKKYGVEFSKKDIKKIIKLIGDKEKVIDPVQAARAALIGGALGAGAGYFVKTNVNQFNLDSNGKPKNINSAKLTDAIPMGVTAATVALGADILGQVFREEKAVSAEVTHDNLDAYYNYLDEAKVSKKGIRIMKELATHFADATGKLDYEEMNKAMRKAAGKDSVLNIDEAQGLIYQLETGAKTEPETKPEPEQETKPVEMPELKPAKITTEGKKPDAKLEKRPTEYKVVVQNGESLSKLAKKYGVTVDELIKLNGFEKFTDDCGEIKIKGFRVGQTIKLPAHANIEAAKNNKTAAEAIKDYENMWKANIQAGKDPCEDDHKVSNVFLNNVRASLQK